MMYQPSIGDLARAFRASTYHNVFLRHQEKERERRERKEEMRADDAELMEFATAMVLASEVAQFRIEIGQYDAATIAALQQNETALELILKQQEALLGQAYVLPDGRRVFKSVDGIQVFDEHGKELDASTIDPNLIEDFRPKWETYKPVLDEKMRLLEERRELLDYQTKLDEARERLDAGDMSREEFDALRDELTATMPEAVRAQIPELADEQNTLTRLRLRGRPLST